MSCGMSRNAAPTASGVAVLFISHRLDEVFEIADRVTVLRDGRLISSRPASEITQAQAIKDMVGRDMSDFFVRNPHPREDVVLHVEGLAREGAFSEVSFDLHEGEVLGFAGLVGAGRTDVGLALFGIAPPDGAAPPEPIPAMNEFDGVYGNSVSERKLFSDSPTTETTWS